MAGSTIRAKPRSVISFPFSFGHVSFQGVTYVETFEKRLLNDSYGLFKALMSSWCRQVQGVTTQANRQMPQGRSGVRMALLCFR